MKYLLGVTGSMGCGKSYVCERLKEEARIRTIELAVISFDEERGKIVQTPEVKAQLLNYFGEEIFSGTNINRQKLAEIMFSDDDKRESAEKIIDSAIIEVVQRKIDSLSSIILVEWARFAEKSRIDLTNYNMLLVTCPYNVQLERLNGVDLPLEQVKKRISLQYSSDEKRRAILQTQKDEGKGDYYEIETSTEIDFSKIFERILNNAN